MNTGARQTNGRKKRKPNRSGTRVTVQIPKETAEAVYAIMRRQVVIPRVSDVVRAALDDWIKNNKNNP